MDQEVKVGIIGDDDPHLRYHLPTDEAEPPVSTVFLVNQQRLLKERR
jgi:hypothetical protein